MKYTPFRNLRANARRRGLARRDNQLPKVIMPAATASALSSLSLDDPYPLQPAFLDDCHMPDGSTCFSQTKAAPTSPERTGSRTGGTTADTAPPNPA